MKWTPNMTDQEWEAAMAARKAVAEARMSQHDMFTIKQVNSAAMAWYGRTDLDFACLAENRLMRGERPEVTA